MKDRQCQPAHRCLRIAKSLEQRVGDNDLLLEVVAVFTGLAGFDDVLDADLGGLRLASAALTADDGALVPLHGKQVVVACIGNDVRVWWHIGTNTLDVSECKGAKENEGQEGRD